MKRQTELFRTAALTLLVLLTATATKARAADPIKINGPLTAGGAVSFSGLQFSPDSSRVVYNADQDTNDVFEIFLVPAEGGTPVKLNGPLVAGGIVSNNSLQFSPDGSKVLYLADQDTDNVTEAYVRIIRDRANSGGGDWDTAGTWDQSVAPDEVMQVFIDTPATVTATGNGTARTVNEVTIGGGVGNSTLNLEAGAIITAINGVRIESGGTLRGDGRISGDVSLATGSEIRAGSVETLTINSMTTANAGRMFLQGGTLEIDSAVTNAAGGEILGRGALFTEGLTNEGQILFSAGVTDVFGDVDNTGAGEIIVSGLGTATFYDDVTHNGDEIRTSAGSATVFFGDVTGSGPYTGTGTVFYEGSFSPGSSPAAVSIEHDAAFGAGSTLEIELGGLVAGDEYDQLLIGGTASLDGRLMIRLLDGFMPKVGDAFEILTYGVLDGTFDEILFAGALDGVVDYGATSLSLTITAVPEPTGVMLFLIAMSALLVNSRFHNTTTLHFTRTQR